MQITSTDLSLVSLPVTRSTCHHITTGAVWCSYANSIHFSNRSMLPHDLTDILSLPSQNHIHRLVSFKAALKLSFGPWTVWFPLKSIIWRKCWNVFIRNLNFFSTEERKTWTSWM